MDGIKGSSPQNLEEQAKAKNDNDYRQGVTTNGITSTLYILQSGQYDQEKVKERLIARTKNGEAAGYAYDSILNKDGSLKATVNSMDLTGEQVRALNELSGFLEENENAEQKYATGYDSASGVK